MVASEQPNTVIRDALSRTINYTEALLGNRKFRRDLGIPKKHSARCWRGL